MHFGWLIYCRVKSSKDEARGDPISHGMQKQLSLARALATFSDPRLTQKKNKDYCFNNILFWTKNILDIKDFKILKYRRL